MYITYLIIIFIVFIVLDIYVCTINYECSVFTIKVYNIHNHIDNVHYQVEAWITEKISVATDES